MDVNLTKSVEDDEGTTLMKQCQRVTDQLANGKICSVHDMVLSAYGSENK